MGMGSTLGPGHTGGAGEPDREALRQGLEAWRNAAAALADALASDLPDAARVTRLLHERGERVAELQALVNALGQARPTLAGSGGILARAIAGDPELQALVTAALELDRQVMERASELRAQVHEQLARVRQGRAALAQYRRAVRPGEVNPPAFVDRQA